MQCTAINAQVGDDTLGQAIAEFRRASEDLGEQPRPEEQVRLSVAFDALLKWTTPASSFGEAVAALHIVRDEFRMEQEGDGLAKVMLTAALGFLGAANAPSRALMVDMPWARRTIAKVGA